MNNGLAGVAEPIDNMTTGLRLNLARVLGWLARGLSLLVGGFYSLLFIASRLNPSTQPLTASDLFIFTCLAIGIIASFAAWRWPRAGGAVALVAATLLAIYFIYIQSSYGFDVLDSLVTIVFLSGPFFTGILFIAEGGLSAKESEAAISTPLTKTPPLTIREIVQRLALLSVPMLVLIGISGLGANPNWHPFSQSDLFTHKVYAYRQWQSTGYYLNPGDRVLIRANGQWLYSPVVGWHGPEGGESAPGYYPLPSSRGGALLGKIGDDGRAFHIGSYDQIMVEDPGMLYVRINDDRLGDNEGELQLSVQIVAPTATVKP